MINFLRKTDNAVEAKITEIASKREAASNWIALAKTDLRQANDIAVEIDLEISENITRLADMKDYNLAEMGSNQSALDAINMADL